MDELITFLRHIATGQEWATTDDPRRDDGGRCEYLLGDHLEPKQMRELFATVSAVADMLEHPVVDGRERDYEATEMLEQVARRLAAIWSDDPEYRPEFAPLNDLGQPSAT